MKRIIQALAVATLFTGTQAALAFAPSGDEVFPQFQSSYSDQYANKGTPAMQFPANGDEAMPVVSSTYADRHAGQIAHAPMVFPAAGDDVNILTATSTRADRFARGAADAAASE